MRLWTIQSPCRLVSLTEQGILHGDWDHLKNGEDSFYVRPYEWMAKQMVARLPDFSGKAPVWGWVTKYDLRAERWNWGNRWMVCIEFEVPDDQVVLSDFDLWHQVLNNFPCSLSEAEWEDFTDREDARSRALFDQGLGGMAGQRIVEAEFREEKEATWQRIFDPDLPWDDEWLGKGPRVWQACVDGLRPEQVRSTRLFRSRETKPW
jgi:hypothetical protein